MAEPSDNARLMGDLLRMATVESVDLAAARCVLVVSDELKTGPLPWFVPAAGETRTWSAPSVGEQGLLICPEGELTAGLFLRGVYSDASPAPLSTDVEAVRFADGSLISYDHEAGELLLQLVGKARLVAPDGLEITADVTITGDVDITGPVSIAGGVDVAGQVDASVDVTAAGKSLKTHKHSGVQTGAAQTGDPV